MLSVSEKRTRRCGQFRFAVDHHLSDAISINLPEGTSAPIPDDNISSVANFSVVPNSLLLLTRLRLSPPKLAGADADNLSQGRDCWRCPCFRITSIGLVVRIPFDVLRPKSLILQLPDGTQQPFHFSKGPPPPGSPTIGSPFPTTSSYTSSSTSRVTPKTPTKTLSKNPGGTSEWLGEGCMLHSVPSPTLTFGSPCPGLKTKLLPVDTTVNY